MKLRLCLSLTILSLAPRTPTVFAQTQPCPTNAVFLALETEVRGYPARANGPTTPCAILKGAQTTLNTANSVSVSVNGYLHVLQFLTNGTVAIFPSDSTGNAAPSRVESTYTNDLIAIATDARVNDFTLSRRSAPAAVTVNLVGSTTPAFFYAPAGFAKSGGLAVDLDGNLLIGGYDASGKPLIQTLGTAANIANPALVRTLSGASTGLYAGDLNDYGHNEISLAIDPVSGELYVYTYSDTAGQQKISVFPPRATGNVAPTRVIAGPLTGIGAPGLLNSKIGVSADGRLFVAEANNRILVFAPGASGNVAPGQIIQDATLGNSAAAQGGVGVRSCQCR